MSDLISRRAAIDAIDAGYDGVAEDDYDYGLQDGMNRARYIIEDLQPAPAIPLTWIETKIDWLISLDNEFSILAAAQIRALVNMWNLEQKEGVTNDKK